jgi:penicillin-binding protein-related factor A (putative recombinase)
MTKPARGMAFEGFLAEYNESLSRRGLAYIVKQHVPVNIDQKMKGGRILGTITGTGACDYMGGVRLGDRAMPIAAEAKETANKTGFYFSALEQNQVDSLAAAHKTGCIAQVWVSSTRVGGGLYVIPWEQLRHWMSLEWKKVTWANLERDGYKVKPGQGWFEWLVEDRAWSAMSGGGGS